MPIEITPWSPQEFPSFEAFIERCGRVSHRSEKKTTPTSYINFMKKVVLLRRDHSVAEHAAFRVRTNTTLATDAALLDILKCNPFVRWVDEAGGRRTLLINARQVIEFLEIPPASRSDLIAGILQNFRPILPTLTAGLDDESGRSYFYPISVESAHEASPHDDLTVATYFIKGISRVTEVQDVRHRMRSYTVMSGRTVDVEHQPFVHPPSIQSSEEAYTRSQTLVRACRDHYRWLLLSNPAMKKEDARYYLPGGLSTEMAVTAPLSVWKLWISLRTPNGAQWEIREEAGLIRDDLVKRFPEQMEGV